MFFVLFPLERDATTYLESTFLADDEHPVKRQLLTSNAAAHFFKFHSLPPLYMTLKVYYFFPLISILWQKHTVNHNSYIIYIKRENGRRGLL